jgi:hypothetical protein
MENTALPKVSTVVEVPESILNSAFAVFVEPPDEPTVARETGVIILGASNIDSRVTRDRVIRLLLLAAV